MGSVLVPSDVIKNFIFHLSGLQLLRTLIHAGTHRRVGSRADAAADAVDADHSQTQNYYLVSHIVIVDYEFVLFS